MDIKELQDLIPVSEAAKRAKVARNTMYLAAKHGNIRHQTIGGRWFIHNSDIERWKKEHYRPDMSLRYPKDDDNTDIEDT